MKVYNYGSINVDHIYRVCDFVRPGETLPSNSYNRVLGGKGANQSIALAKAGLDVNHIGRISKTDTWIQEKLLDYGVSTQLIQTVDEPTGHAIIQVSDKGENAIILFGGANQTHSEDSIRDALKQCSQGDYLLLQNECNLTQFVLELAKEQGMTVVFNPAPMTEDVKKLSLDSVDYLIVNEIEAEQLLNNPSLNGDEPEALLKQLRQTYPNVNIVMTLGSKGVLYGDKTQIIQLDAKKVEVVDTTAAGDTFVGYFMQQIITGKPVETALKVATEASAITVQNLGASDSIPDIDTLKSLALTD